MDIRVSENGRISQETLISSLTARSRNSSDPASDPKSRRDTHITEIVLDNNSPPELNSF